VTRGLLIVGHGTRDEAGRAEFLSLTAQVAARVPHVRVQSAFLELVEPSVEEGLRLLAAGGVQRVIVQPLLLFAAAHLKHDLPMALHAMGGGMQIELAPHLGCHPVLVRLSVERFVQAAGRAGAWEARPTLTILVGRGTSDAEGQAEFGRFVRLRREACPTEGFEHCFVAAAEPALEPTLLRACASSYRRVVVQPHLLFRGEVLHAVAEAVERMRQAVPHQEWLLVPHLGPDMKLAEMVAELALRLQPHTAPLRS
jgi:sirohydrochlorin ferrochelatase